MEQKPQNYSYILGFDVGGTNTDSVLVKVNENNEKVIIHYFKINTSPDIITGIEESLDELLKKLDEIG